MLNVSPPANQAADWQYELRNSFTRVTQLLRALKLSPDAADCLQTSPFPFRVSRHFAAKMTPGDADDPLLRQVLPATAEQEHAPGFVSDPVGDRQAMTVPGVIHKYHGRLLLIATGACAIHCRYCFRREYPYAQALAARDQWRQAVAYIRRQPDITEVILSGGDPLLLATDKLRSLTDSLRDIPQLRSLRIHTRLPTVLPQRFTASLYRWIESLPWRKVLVLHANHPRELDQHSDRIAAALKKRSVLLFNQSVLLRGINDSAETQEQLCQRLAEAGYLPYYLHLLDQVSGASGYQADSAKARAIMEQLRRRLPGYLVPKLVKEVPGEPNKVPIL